MAAFALRLWCLERGGGLYGYSGYDDGVYFSAATAFVFGRLPYRDFVLLHPPGIVLALSPFAALGRLTGDRDAMAVARVAFIVIGSLNAALTAWVAAVFGRLAALVAGGFMAVWLYSAYVDHTPFLEPLGSSTLLAALLLLRRQPPAFVARAELLAGVALGLGACVKLWGVVPLAVLAVVVLAHRGWRPAARLATGAAIAGAAVMGPFLLLAPGAALRMTVADQLGRPRNGDVWDRLPRVLGVDQYVGQEHKLAIVLVAVTAGVMLAILTVLAWRAGPARPWVALLAANLTVLLAAPLYFPHYAGFVAVPLALVLGAGAAELSRALAKRPGSAERVLVALASTALVVLGVGTAHATFGVRYPGGRLAEVLPTEGCVRADDPSALIQLNALSRDLRRHCTVHIDFTGVTYDRLARFGPDGRVLPRRRNPAWQEFARAYLMSGSATVVMRDSGFDEQTRRQLRMLPVLGRVGPWSVLGSPGTARSVTPG